MESKLHKHLKSKAMNYLANKGYWIRSTEAPTPVGVIDAWGMTSMDFSTAAIEVKVSRSDYKSKSQKYKEFSAENIANFCYLLCPRGLITEEESPKWGILWYYEESDRLRLIRHPQYISMTDREKLAIMLHCLYSGVNDPDKRLNVDPLSHSLQQAREDRFTTEELELIKKDMNGLLDVDKMMRKVTVSQVPDERFVAMMAEDEREQKLREKIVKKIQALSDLLTKEEK